MKIAPYRLIPYRTLIPYAYIEEPKVKLPLTAYSAKNYIGRRLLIAPMPQMGDPIIVSDTPKASSDQPTFLLIGPRGTGKTILIRVLVENAWFNNFTPIFIISPKNDYLNMDQPNYQDVISNLKYHREWMIHLVGRDILPLDTTTRKKLFTRTFNRNKFNLRILVPPHTKIRKEYREKTEPYKLNPRLLDAYQIADLITRPAESVYIKQYDKIYHRLWSKNPNMTFRDFLELFVKEAKEVENKNIQERLKYIHNTLVDYYETGYIAKSGANTLIKYFREKTIVNFTFHDQTPTMQNIVLISNFIRQVIETVQKYKLSSFLIIDDLAFFKRSLGRREESPSLTRVLDELINIQGRTTDAGIRIAFAVQTEKQLPKKLNQKILYNYIFYTRPRTGYIRATFRALETEMIDNIANRAERLFIRLPITAKGG